MVESWGECIGAICECTLRSIWAIVSLVLGLVFGTLVGAEMTVMIFLLTLIRTPHHILKNLFVAATTKTCFAPCQYFDPFLRVIVFCLVPIPHLLFLVGAPACCLVFGTLYYIGKATKTIFKGSYAKQWNNTWTNIRLDKDSRLGEYSDLLDGFTQDDNNMMAEDICFALKAICSFLPGIPLGALPFIPFTVAIVFITLYRLPINVYKTIRIAIRTVTLKWDLKILALLMLPIIHTVFPLVIFVSALVGSFLFFTLCTSISIAEGNSPFEEWDTFRTGIKDYYKAHQNFVGDKYLGKYDHPTGIPSGWRGQQYGLPIHQILQWQWDFLVCCVLVLFGMPICLIGSTIIFAIKLVPGIVSWWRKLCTQLTSGTLTEILGCWAFWFCGFLLTPVAAVLACAAAIIGGTLMSLRIPHDYLVHGCKGGMYAPFQVLREVDSWDFFFIEGCQVFVCLPDENPYRYNTKNSRRSSSSSSRRRRDRKADKKARQQFSKTYWDRFASQCIQTTERLLENGWVSLEDVQGFDTSVLQAVPAIALLQILFDSIHDPEAKSSQHIRWRIDGTRCDKVDKEQLDNIATLLWPKVMEVKRILQWGRKKGALAQETNVNLLGAMMCSNTDETTEALEAFLKDHEEDPKNRAANVRIRSKLTELTLMILQVRPFQDRMQAIFNYRYNSDEEEGPTAETTDETTGNGETEQQSSRWRTVLSQWWQALGEEASRQWGEDTATTADNAAH